MAESRQDANPEPPRTADEVVIAPVSDADLDLFTSDAPGDADVIVIDEAETTETSMPVQAGAAVVISDGSEEREVTHLGADGPGYNVLVECPGCGLLCEGVDPRPTAAWFCPNCDYPLFLADPAPPAVTTNTALARRRLPGTDGRELLGADACWACGERNPPGTMNCVRCGSQLIRPAPPAPLDVPTLEPADGEPLVFVARRWLLVTGGAVAGAVVALLAVWIF